MVRRDKGFTLVELVLVVTTVGILTWVAMLQSYATHVKIQAAARRIQSDIRYAQELAMTKGKAHQIRFYSSANPTPTNRYEIVTAGGEAVKDPLTGESPYVVDFNSGTFSGVLIDTTATVEFNSLGQPTLGGGATISLNGESKVITVTAETGRIVF